MQFKGLDVPNKHFAVPAMFCIDENIAGAMKPLNMLPVFEKGRLSSVFPEGRRPLIFAGNEILIMTGSCGRLQTHHRWRSGIWPAGQKHADSSFPHRPRHR